MRVEVKHQRHERSSFFWKQTWPPCWFTCRWPPPGSSTSSRAAALGSPAAGGRFADPALLSPPPAPSGAPGNRKSFVKVTLDCPPPDLLGPGPGVLCQEERNGPVPGVMQHNGGLRFSLGDLSPADADQQLFAFPGGSITASFLDRFYLRGVKQRATATFQSVPQMTLPRIL